MVRRLASLVLLAGLLLPYAAPALCGAARAEVMADCHHDEGNALSSMTEASPDCLLTACARAPSARIGVVLSGLVLPADHDEAATDLAEALHPLALAPLTPPPQA
jgi:hypothetical protein